MQNSSANLASATDRFDVVVIGGGHAGAEAARLTATLQHRRAKGWKMNRMEAGDPLREALFVRVAETGRERIALAELRACGVRSSRSSSYASRACPRPEDTE